MDLDVMSSKVSLDETNPGVATAGSYARPSYPNELRPLQITGQKQRVPIRLHHNVWKSLRSQVTQDLATVRGTNNAAPATQQAQSYYLRYC